ncbi:hypothetical protein R5R35_000930 [Gryllus longicercus]|uniref:RNA-directed DNA polymerase n=1 Tax=Gryllus longicercus TaxID=2509291 RepID=A0AAN9VRA8_9ORTH
MCSVQMEENEIKEEIRKKVMEQEKLRVDQKNALYEMLISVKDVFKNHNEPVKGYQFRIELTDSRPFKAKNYPIPVAYRDEVRKLINEMIQEGVIRKATTAYTNPILVVKKKDGSLRLCLDARRLNAVTVPYRDVPPRIADMLLNFGGHEWFTSTDFRHAYWQMPIAQEDQQYTGFTFDGITFVFKRVPFGLKNSGAALIQCLDSILQKVIERRATLYVDDLIIQSRSFNEHVEDLKMIFQTLIENNLTLNLNKTYFCVEKFDFLGYEVSREGVKMKKDKAKEIDDIPAPKNVKQLRSLLGMLNYYSRFCPNYALVVAPLYDLLRKNRKWAWEIEHQRAFHEVKAMFRNSCVIAHPDFSEPMILQTDSSAYGIAAVLLQKQGEEYKIIQLVSKSLRGPQLRYSVTEKEAYGVVWSVMKLRQYLTGRTFIIRTDHKSLTFLNRCFTENDRLKRWIIWLQRFDFQIQHCPGRENKLPDFLSRYGKEVQDKSRAETRLVVAPIDLKVPQQLQWEWSNVIAWQEQDENMAEIMRIKEGRADNSPLKQQHDQDPEKWHVVDGLLTIRVRRQPPTYRIWIPKSKVDDLIGYVHCKNAHYGANKILIHIQELCYWKGMARDVRRVVSKCNTCLTTKHPNRKYAGAMHNIIPAGRNDLLAIDIYGPLPRTTNGNKYVLVMVDVFSKFTRVYPINKTNATNCLHQIEKHFEIAGAYSRILSDHGTQFTSTK